MNKFLSFFFLFSLVCSFSFAGNEFELGVAPHYGFIIQHRPPMQGLITGHTRGFECTFSTRTSGNKYWHQVYKMPKIGVKLYGADLGNPGSLGRATGIAPYFNFPFVQTKSFDFGFTVATGIGYITKTFNVGENHKNAAISSHINGMMHGELGMKYNLSSAVGLSAGLSLVHFSNGAYKVPNLGINIVSLTAGLYASFGNTIPLVLPDTTFLTIVPPAGKRGVMNYEIMASFGLKEVYPYGGKKFPMYDVSFLGLKTLNRKSRLGYALDLFCNTSLNQLLADSAGNKPNPDQLFRLGIALPYELVVSRFTVALKVGVYLLNPYKKDGMIYQTLGFHYKISEHLFANYSLKLHFGKADNLELGLGYSF